MNKLSRVYQNQFSAKLLYDRTILDRIDKSVKIHDETERHPLSSSAACLNVIGALAQNPNSLRHFLNAFKLELDEVVEFPSGADVGGRCYNDKGFAVFEWVGPKKSPLLEVGGGRGQNRTSIDAFVIGKRAGKLVQVLIEWKFTEGDSRELTLGRFCGRKGVERFRRYATILAALRKKGRFPFAFAEEFCESDPRAALSLADFSVDPLYQLMRMTLLAMQTTPLKIGELKVDEYAILHLSHSQNARINILEPKYLTFSPGLQSFAGQQLHTVWPKLLTETERQRFFSGHWDKALPAIEDTTLRDYLMERYGTASSSGITA